MKYALILIVAIAAVATIPLTEADKGGKGKEPPGGIIKCIRAKIQGNSTLLNALITALNNAGLSQYVNNTSVDFNGLEQNLFSVLPQLADFLNTNIVPTYPKIGTTITAALSVIDSLTNNQTAQTQAGAYLLFINYSLNSQFVSSVDASPAQLNVDFASIQGNASAAKYLNRYLAVLVQRILKPGNMGPWGPFNDGDRNIRF